MTPQFSSILMWRSNRRLRRLKRLSRLRRGSTQRLLQGPTKHFTFTMILTLTEGDYYNDQLFTERLPLQTLHSACVFCEDTSTPPRKSIFSHSPPISHPQVWSCGQSKSHNHHNEVDGLADENYCAMQVSSDWRNSWKQYQINGTWSF